MYDHVYSRNNFYHWWGALVNEQEQQPTLTHQLVFILMYNDQQII